MDDVSVTPWEIVAQAFCYPAPGQHDWLRNAVAQMPAGLARSALEAYWQGVSDLPLGKWEELHTRTLDLNPPAAPYVGFQTWGESYQRGTFLSKLNRELMKAQVDPAGELPDHLIPVLRYLGRAPDPLPDLVTAFDTALQRMIDGLRKVDPRNPYISLLEAAQVLGHSLNKEAA